MKSQHDSLCPCNSGKRYEHCCKLFHEGIEKAKSALELMMSRYSAYATHHGEYIVNTTHATNVEYTKDVNSWLYEINDFMKMTTFQKLNIIDYFEESHEAYVIFQAVLSINGKDCSFTERSRFLKENNEWFYASGEIFEQI